MASLQIVGGVGRGGGGGFRWDFRRKSCCSFCLESGKNFLKTNPKRFLGRRRRMVSCRLKEEGDSETNGEEPPESLFMKELRRRGMTPTSLLEESKPTLDKEVKLKEDDRSFSQRNVVSTDYEKSLSNQRERSMALNSEGLEGLVPRAKLLLTLGGTFFLGFWPLILITVAFFSSLYFYFGPAFIHDASRTPIAPPPYIDPYTLLEDERLSQGAPLVK